MKPRLLRLLSLITPCKTFADIGCDHGYIAKAVLDNNLCDHVYITDISKPSLNKAINLLSKDYVGKFTAVCGFGFDFLPKIDEAIIAGLGGEEIIQIIKKSAYKPEILILQPMKNADKLRVFLHNIGYGLKRDFMFISDGKYYETMVAVSGLKDDYNSNETLYGRENLNGNKDFIGYLEKKIKETEKIFEGNLSDTNKQEIQLKLDRLRGIKDEIKRDLRTD